MGVVTSIQNCLQPSPSEMFSSNSHATFAYGVVFHRFLADAEHLAEISVITVHHVSQPKNQGKTRAHIDFISHRDIKNKQEKHLLKWNF